MPRRRQSSDFIGAARPGERDGQALEPIYGRSWKPYLTGERTTPVRGPTDALGFEMIECRAVIKGEWAAYASSVGYIEAGEIKQLEGMSPEDFFRFEGLA